MTDEKADSNAVVPKKYLLTFCLVTVLFALWGFANNFTDPMVKVFKDVFAVSNWQSSFVQMAFYGGYATMAIPAALFIRKYTYKSGIVVGLFLFAVGALISIPAANYINFWLFIFGLYILTFGLAFLETTANPFILSMGSDETSTRRLNLAQAFNPVGSLAGLLVAGGFVFTNVYVNDFKTDINQFKKELNVSKSGESEHYILPFLKAKIDPKGDENAKQYVYEESVAAIEFATAYDATENQLKEISEDLSLLKLRKAVEDEEDKDKIKAAIDKLLDGAGKDKITDELRESAHEYATADSGYVGLIEEIAELSKKAPDSKKLTEAKEKRKNWVSAGSLYSAYKQAIDDNLETFEGMDLDEVKTKAGEFLSFGVSSVSTDKALRDFQNGKIESYQGTKFNDFQRHDLNIVSTVYMTLGFVVLATMFVFLIQKMPKASAGDDGVDIELGPTFLRLAKNPRYVFGVIAQMFYVGVQIMVWTYIIQYAEYALGIDNQTATNHQTVALVIFLTFRFICTAFLKYVSPGKLLAALALGGILFTLGAIHIEGMTGLYSLMMISACMSLMFPTIYGIALEGLGQDAKLGSAGLIFAIVGGVWLTGFQGKLIDLETFMGTTGIRGSFYLSVGCFIIIAIYGLFCRNPRVSESATT